MKALSVHVPVTVYEYIVNHGRAAFAREILMEEVRMRMRAESEKTDDMAQPAAETDAGNAE